MNFWRGKRVLITGHTGFKGAWLTLWLLEAGAHITGLALEPDTEPALFNQLGLSREIDHRIADICEYEAVARVIADAKPDVLLHMAAQSLVLRGYREPVATWNTNVMGTVHVLEALRRLNQPCAVVIVTTDKVYENREWEYGYRETDPLGGHDPYSASKAAAEIAVACWRRSYTAGTCIRVASARAGNVIGGGDWCENRIVPDIARALAKGEAVAVRNPNAVRPWQHVLEPLGGYLELAKHLSNSDAPQFQEAFNFGPSADANRSVSELVQECLRHWPGGRANTAESLNAPHEAGKLALVTDRAQDRLGWQPRWNFERSVRETISWYRESIGADTASLRRMSQRSINAFVNEARVSA